MNTFVLVKKDSYHDSVLLMRLSVAVRQLPGVSDAEVVMGTPLNRTLLGGRGFGCADLDAAGPNDLAIAVRGDLDVAAVEGAVTDLLKAQQGGSTVESRPSSLAAALAVDPDANLVLISVPGEHAAREARRAIHLGRHVMLFSDNVTVEDEVTLKREAVERGLLMMGPDCGTAIVNGKPLAFANVVRRGSIGCVAAAGTGLQEVTCCIDRLGGGVSQAIGVGGHDLSEAVGGLMTLFGIAALNADEKTSVIAVVSKPPHPSVAMKILGTLATCPKPCVVHFVGAEPGRDDPAGGVYFAASLAETAEVACRLAGVVESEAGPDFGEAQVDDLASVLADQLKPGARLIGLFCGGTTGAEALAILTRMEIEVRSNLHKEGPLKVSGADPVPGHAILDLGDDLFTRGRPHPMIEPVLRNERLALELADPAKTLYLADCILGHGSHPDPAGVLAKGVKAARRQGADIVVIASVTGTELDPQNLAAQRETLKRAGVVLAGDNRRAAELAAKVLWRVR
jgi:FdrA protein